MDLETEIDIFNDKKNFLSRIKGNPLFLFLHLRSLLNILFEKYKFRFFIKLRGQHRGSKRKPVWLKDISIENCTQCKNFSMLIHHIPSRDINKFTFRNTAISETFVEVADPEDYLAKHRWSMLIDDLFEHTKTLLPWQLPISVSQSILNPADKQDYSWEAYSTCERICNILTWISFVPLNQRAVILPESLFFYLEESMQWVLTHLEYYGKKTNNHIINNARCLIMAGTVLSNARAVATGVTILQHMLDKLIKPEGSLRERSSHYQLLVTTWLLDAYFFLKSSAYSHFSILKVLEKNIKNMLETAAITCDKLGYLQAYIGDISPDLTPEKSAKRLMLCYPAYWPIANQGVNSRDDWRILKNKANKIVINCPAGPYPNSFPSHAHNDITSFVWLHDQAPILIDSGRARYTKDPISLYQKSGIGHNIPLVNGFSPLCESFVTNGSWQPKPYAVAHVKISEKQNAYIKISHDGFKRATPVNFHERTIFLHENHLQISDSFFGKDKVEIMLYWHFHTSFAEFDKNYLCIRNNDTRISIGFDSHQMLPRIKYYGVDMQHSWQSSQYGFVAPSPVIVMYFEVKLPFTVHTNFRVEPCVE